MGNAADVKPHETRHRPVKSNRPVSPDGTHSLEERRNGRGAMDGPMDGPMDGERSGTQ